MKRTLVRGALALGMAAMLAGVATAQPSRRGSGGTGTPRIDTSTVITVQGEVVTFQAGLGQGMPELVVRDGAGTVWTLVLGPFTYLQSQGFVVSPGDRVDATGYSCPTCEHGLAVAQVANLTRGTTLVLRDADGRPVWIGAAGQSPRRHLSRARGGAGIGMGSAGSPGAGPGTGGGPAAPWRGGQRLCGGEGPDLMRASVFAGTVVSFTGAAGAGSPTLLLATTAGEVTITLSPYRVLLQADYAPAVGAALEVKAAPVLLDGEEHWVTLTLTDVASGLELVFRDPETGLPIVLGRRSCR